MSNIKYQMSSKNCIQLKYWIWDIGYSEGGFTIIELAVVIGIASILLGIVGLSFTHTQHNVNISGATDVLVSDIRQQQLKSMTGDTSGTGVVSAYGIYFQSYKYTLFSGNAYSSGDANNFTVNLDQNLQFANDTFPGTSLVFENGTGKFTGYSSTTNSIQIKDAITGQSATIAVNRLGVITQAN